MVCDGEEDERVNDDVLVQSQCLEASDETGKGGGGKKWR